MTMKKLFLAGLLMFLFVLPRAASAAEAVGIVTAIKGNAIIKRGSEMLTAKLKGEVFVDDTISVAEFSRMKIKFTDDSVLTLYQNSSLNVKEYMYKNDGTKGRSVYRLIDGKLKSLVGKTNFEVHTATSVAAARGTHFFLQCTATDCLLAVFEGTVGFRNISEDVSDEILIGSGTYSTVKIVDGKLTSPSGAVPMPKGMIKDLLSCKIVQPDE